MKLKFIENNGEISTKIINGQTESEFNYITFINYLYNGEEIEDPLFEGDISVISKDKLDDMISRINSMIVESKAKNESSEGKEVIEEVVFNR